MTTTAGGDAALGAVFDPFERSAVDDPFPLWTHARETAPVFRSDRLDAWVVTEHALLEEVFRDPVRFPSRGLAVMTAPPPEAAAILASIEHVPPLRATDPPEHARQRRPTLAAVSPRRVAGLEEPIRAVASELVDEMWDEGAADFYRAFAYPFPLRVISNLLGFSRADAERLHHWAACRVRLAWGRMDPQQWVEAARGMVEFHEFVTAQVLDRRDRPRDDGLSDFVRGALAAEAPMNVPEIVEQTIGLVTGGHETTANWLTLSMFHLLSRRERWEAVVDGRYALDDLVEETLRFDGSVRAVWRRAGTGTVLGGVPIAEGERLYCVIGAANRDPATFPAPDEFTPGRERPRQHLAFGRATHHCIGAGLARLEGRIAFEVLAARLPSVRLVSPRLACEDNATLRIVTGLDIAWD